MRVRRLKSVGAQRKEGVVPDTCLAEKGKRGYHSFRREDTGPLSFSTDDLGYLS